MLLCGHIHVLFQVELHVQNDDDDDNDDFRLQMGHQAQRQREGDLLLLIDERPKLCFVINIYSMPSYCGYGLGH